jgi:hypothetical protein
MDGASAPKGNFPSYHRPAMGNARFSARVATSELPDSLTTLCSVSGVSGTTKVDLFWRSSGMMLSATRLLAAQMRAQSRIIRSLESSVPAERQRPPWRILWWSFYWSGDWFD